MNAIPPSAELDPLPRLWAVATVLLAEAIKMFGAPNGASHIRHPLRRMLSLWVRSLEELVRKLLLVEALTHLPAIPVAPWRPPIAKRPAFLAHTRSGPKVATARPSARFNLAIPRDKRFVPNDRAPRIRALWDQPSVWMPPTARAPQQRGDRLALRLAAVQRVIEKPAAYVRRLAARLAQLARDQRARASIRFACRGPDLAAPGFGIPLRDASRLVFACTALLTDSS